ncbi:lipopolysaccharide biosynthesis protein [Sulfurirhabdus autotrophica]|uniref:lipopolysaccharide biosynthesis protein n=1 Tax=Sulfurirhabdus autotrophica TaxID=1706046 RepID=UPI000F607EDC|nr:lipopolysaccharide biosynthesis protein [Sulfurirhabdus autotrophica]
MLIARGLNPSGYGDLMFLLGSFVAIRSLLDMGSSSAFYTFMSRHVQGPRFYSFYFTWLVLQFVITLLFVALIIPDNIFARVWLGHNREIVLITLLAAFMQQQVWQTVSQIGESMRKTVKVQLLNLFIAIFYLAMVSLLLILESMSIENILFLMIVQYVLATLLAYQFFREDQAGFVEKDATLKQIFQEYWVYCKPLIALSLVSFLYDFADKWMLQKFGGSTQQGYFQIASQFSTVSLLATTSILSIFWKEISNALAKHDHARVTMLYHKVSRGLVMLGAIITGLLLPWAEQIVTVFLGPSYVQAWPVLAIMLLYPIHQSMGQIGGTMLLAGGHTHKYMVVSMMIMLVSVPFSYLMLAPAAGALVPGLGMGAVGIASKTVLLSIVAVNIQALVIARYSGWKFDWLYQVIGIPLMVGLGYLAKMFVGLLWNSDGTGNMTDLIISVMLTFLVYGISVTLVLWLLPWLFGMEREEIEYLFRKSKS